MMRWRLIRLGRTEVALHPALLLCLLYAWLTGHGLFMLIAVGSILLHEGAHALVSLLLGYPPQRLEITPLGAVMHLDEEHRMPPLRHGLMLAAGPGMTLLLCWGAIQLVQLRWLSMAWGRLIFLANLSILLMNLLPALPLDGGRLLSLLLKQVLPLRQVSRVMQGIGSVLGIGMILLNVVTSLRFGGWNLSLAFAGCCLLYSAATATMTCAMAELRGFVDRKIALERKGCQEICWIACLHTTPLRMLVRQLPARRMGMFLCIETGSMRLLGQMDEAALLQAYLQNPETLFCHAIQQRKGSRNPQKSGTK